VIVGEEVSTAKGHLLALLIDTLLLIFHYKTGNRTCQAAICAALQE